MVADSPYHKDNSGKVPHDKFTTMVDAVATVIGMSIEDDRNLIRWFLHHCKQALAIKVVFSNVLCEFHSRTHLLDNCLRRESELNLDALATSKQADAAYHQQKSQRTP